MEIIKYTLFTRVLKWTMTSVLKPHQISMKISQLAFYDNVQNHVSKNTILCTLKHLYVDRVKPDFLITKIDVKFKFIRTLENTNIINFFLKMIHTSFSKF